MTRKESLLPSLGLWSGPAIKRFRSGIEAVFDDFFSSDWSMDIFADMQPKASFPKVNVFETDNEYNVEIAVAGFSKDDVKLELKDNDLLISADKKEQDGESKNKYLRQEISYRSFKRVVRFPYLVDADKVAAEYKDGIIYFKVEKKKEQNKDSGIPIEVK